jgi:hypothetical protein
MSDEAWIDTVRLARDLGDVSQLLPDGVRSLRDIPWRLQQAIKTALMYLGFEELPPEDVPPRNIWSDGPLLREHFDRVRTRHEERSSGREIEDETRNATIEMLVV